MGGMMCAGKSNLPQLPSWHPYLQASTLSQYGFCMYSKIMSYPCLNAFEKSYFWKKEILKLFYCLWVGYFAICSRFQTHSFQLLHDAGF